MLKNSKTVYYLALEFNRIFYGTMKEDFTTEDGRFMPMDKVKNMEKEFNMFQVNISIKVHFRMEKDLAMAC
jgi:hypothetical protein